MNELATNIPVVGSAEVHGSPQKMLLPAEHSSVIRFEDALGVVMESSFLPVLEQVPKALQSTHGEVLGDKLVRNLTEVDKDYRVVLNRLADTEGFDKYLEKHASIATEEVRVHHSNLEPVQKKSGLTEVSDNMQSMLNEQRGLQSAAIDYSRVSMRWHLGTQLWLTKIKMLTSVVAQTSKGLKTLFRA
jgi:hypothetical protein